MFLRKKTALSRRHSIQHLKKYFSEIEKLANYKDDATAYVREVVEIRKVKKEVEIIAPWIIGGAKCWSRRR